MNSSLLATGCWLVHSSLLTLGSSVFAARIGGRVGRAIADRQSASAELRRDTSVIACCLSLFVLTASIALASEEPLAVTVFYSKDDPQWKNAEFVIDGSTKPYGNRVAVEKVSYDDPKGYARLAKIEKELPVERPGEVTAVIGRFALTSSGERRDVENYIAPVVARMLAGEKFKSRLAAEATAFARERFPGGSVEVKRSFGKLGGTYHRVSRNGALLGWIVDAYRTIHCPVCYDAQLLVAVSADPELKVLGIRPVRPLELYGKPLPEKRLRPYLRQFEGLKPGGRQRIDAITGATKTSLAYEKSVKEVLQVLKERGRPAAGPGGGR